MPALPVIEFLGLSSLLCEEPFIVPMHRISMMPISTFRDTGARAGECRFARPKCPPSDSVCPSNYESMIDMKGNKKGVTEKPGESKAKSGVREADPDKAWRATPERHIHS